MHERRARHIIPSTVRSLANVGCVLTLAGCVASSQDGGGQCAEVAACGGDLVGTWELEAFCGDLGTPPNVPAACNDLFADIRVQPGAVYTFDGTTSVVEGITLEADFVYTQPCVEALTQPGVQLDAAFCQSAEDSINDDPDFDGGSCTFTAGACRCTAYVTRQDSTQPTGYHIEGNTLVDESDDSRSGYCVQGDTLVIHAPDMVGDISGQLVLHRQ